MKALVEKKQFAFASSDWICTEVHLKTWNVSQFDPKTH